MIPVELPGGNFYPMLVASLVCLATLFTWVAVLCTTRSARYRLRARLKSSLTLMCVLAAVGAVFPLVQGARWLGAQRAARVEAAHTIILGETRVLGGITLPTGTRLRVLQPGDVNTYEAARFPSTADIGGIKATRLNRYLARTADGSAYRVTGASAMIAQDQAIAGWQCGHGHKVEFKTAPGDDTLRFSSCHLGPGNALDGQPLPAGTWVSVRSANGPSANPAATDGWLLRTDGSESVSPLPSVQMPLLQADLRLDTQRHLVSFEGTLAQEWALGPVTYPTGTRVASAASTLPGASKGDLIFSPSRGRAAKRQGDTDVAAGKSILQARDGTVRSVLDNRAAGVLDFASLSVAP